MQGDFTDKLAFVMKALALSRGRLAADLAVNKSVVSRWLSGAAAPTSHNMTRITALVAEHVPGFTMLDWELAAEALASRLLPAPGADPNRPLAFPLIDSSSAEIAASGERLAGLWRSTRASVLREDAFIREHCLIRRQGGQLTVRLFSDRYDYPGWIILNRGRVDMLYGDVDLVHAMLAPPDTPIVEAMDGLMLTPAADGFRSPAALPVLFERLSPPGIDDPEDAALAEMIEAARREDVYLREEDVEPALGAHLRMQGGPASGGSPHVMMMGAARSLGRGRWF